MANYNLSGVYDLLLYPFLNKVRQITAQKILQYKPKSLIDICCGTGNQLKQLTNKDIGLTGIDNSPHMLKNANELNCYLQDATDIKFPKGSFDMAIIQLALHEKTNDVQQKIVSEIYRIVKKDGYIIVVDYEMGKHTRKSAKYIIYAIEYIAGKEHYKNFKQYLRNGGINELFKTPDFRLVEKDNIAGNAMAITIFQKQRD